MDAPNFIPQIIKNCEDINEQLQQFCLASKIPLQHVWFDVINVHTLLKIHEKDKYRAISGNEFAQFEKDSFYTKQDFFVQQTYDIRIKPKIKDYSLDLEITPEADRVYLVLDAHFTIIDDEQFYEEIFGVIDSLMAQKKIIFRQQYEQRQNLKVLLQELSKQKSTHQSQTLLLKTAPDFIPAKPAEFNFIPKIQWEKSGKEAPENSFFGIRENEIIAEYIKSVGGKSGRNLKGIYIKINPNQSNVAPSLIFNGNIINKEETPEKILYKSLITGYVKIANDNISFHTDFELQSVKTTNTPMLLGGLKSDITLTIQSENDFSDAIDANMIIEASVINVIGSIGENVELSAQKISIKGQTHQSSIINAQEADITVHKGQIYGDKINVKNLDNGFIQADDISIETANGGNIYAKKIKIKTLKSNNKINLSQELDIKSIQGGENKITIATSCHKKTKETMEFISKKISLLREKMQSMMKEYQLIMGKAKQNKPIIDKIKSADSQTQKAMFADETIKKTYHDFAAQIKQLKSLKKELIDLQEETKKLTHSLMLIENESLDAKILTQTEWKFENEVVYHRDYPKPSDDVLMLQDGDNFDIRIDYMSKKLKTTS